MKVFANRIITLTASTTALLVLLVCGAPLSAVVDAVSPVYELHGSGTSNPSKCYWSIMETLKEQADVPLHLTYRAMGTTQGIAEFTSMYNDPRIVSKFGSGDIPLKSSEYAKTTPDGMLHLPVLIGAISFFHTVPDVTDLKLTPCLLSQIYQLKITTWGDDAIVALNPSLPASARETKIIVAHRAEGSSTAYSSAEWMNEQCSNDDEKLPIELVTNLPAWPKSEQTRDTCLKTAGMAQCIQKEIGVIGYLDAGHGQSAGLSEVMIQAKGEYTKSSLELIQSAVVASNLPSSPEMDFSAVSFVTDGSNGWPIVNLTYLFVRKNITSYITDKTEQALLIAFIRALYTDEYVQQCADKYGFVIPGKDIRDYALAAIDTLVTNDAVGEFFYEVDKITTEAANRRNVFSTHRLEIADIEREALLSDVADINAMLGGGSSGSSGDVAAQLAMLKKEMSAFGSSEQSNLRAAVLLSVLSFIMWVLYIITLFYRYCNGNVTTHHNNDNDGGLANHENGIVKDHTSRI